MDVSMISALNKEDVMDSALLFLKDNAVAVGIVLTIVGLIGGAIGASVRFLIDSKKIENEKKALRQQMITNNIAPMRQAWINDIRTKITKLLSLLDYIATYRNSHESDNEEWKVNIKKIYDENILLVDELYIYILIALPFSRDGKKEGFADEIRDKIKSIYKKLQGSAKLSNDEYNIILDDIHSCLEVVKLLLKKEWEETKSLKEIE